MDSHSSDHSWWVTLVHGGLCVHEVLGLLTHGPSNYKNIVLGLFAANTIELKTIHWQETTTICMSPMPMNG